MGVVCVVGVCEQMREKERKREKAEKWLYVLA